MACSECPFLDFKESCQELLRNRVVGRHHKQHSIWDGFLHELLTNKEDVPPCWRYVAHPVCMETSTRLRRQPQCPIHMAGLMTLWSTRVQQCKISSCVSTRTCAPVCEGGNCGTGYCTQKVEEEPLVATMPLRHSMPLTWQTAPWQLYPQGMPWTRMCVKHAAQAMWGVHVYDANGSAAQKGDLQ